MRSMVRISALLWADILVDFALFVMQNYLTGVWNISFTHAAGILNIWNGIAMILPVLFLFIRDALLGNFAMLMITSTSYTVGIGFVAMSVPPVLANPCKEYESKCIGSRQEALFYTGMALIALGLAGNLIFVIHFLKEQNEKNNEDVSMLDCIKLPTLIMVVVVPIVGAIALPYIKPWTLRFGIPAICTAVATFSFYTGWCCYPYDIGEPKGSPITNICRVFVAFASKVRQPHPLDARQLYTREGEVQTFGRTRFLRCLEKAAIVRQGIDRTAQEKNRWKLCSVAEVEEAKITVRMVPMWLTFIICGVVSSFGNTYFVEQGSKLNRHIGKWNVPLPVLLLYYKCVKNLIGKLAAKLVATWKTYGPPVGIALAMVFSILCCITAAKIEQKRLNTIRKHDLIEKPDDKIPMSIYWLLFQFFLLAGLDSFFEKSVAAFYDHQAPETMKEYLVYLTKGVFGLGFMANVLSVYVVGKISVKGGRSNWFQFTLNKSRLDRYYWVLSGLSSVNLLVFIVVASCYRYKNPKAIDRDPADVNISGVETGNPEERQYCPCCFGGA